MSLREDAARRLARGDDKQCVAVAVWCSQDVIDAAEERGIKLTPDQADEIIDYVDRKQDAEIGINWAVINSAIDWLISD